LRAPGQRQETEIAARPAPPETDDQEQPPSPTSTTLLDRASRTEERAEVFREAVTMVLYVSVVEIAELAALPEKHLADGAVSGPIGGQLLAVVWGTAVGLALAHWFAFRLAAPAFRGERPTRLDRDIGLAQVAGAAFVAALSSLPVLVLPDRWARETTGDVPAALIGIVTYLIARHLRASRLASVSYAVTAVAIGVVIALVKGILAGH
jgi:hypothetical protein